ncbi:MAG: hypothetical protein JO190_00730 [Candidatus Eremiobacteraeota bacterium]|nr:hypothetical protein [Candidatus Eremiobacteraeota bacterium]MBV8498395.1 hypothetical protein [Candidatus Eremiobacteraeota bacterium]
MKPAFDPSMSTVMARRASTETTVYSFMGGADGSFPQGGLLADLTGVFYGTTSSGGSADAGTVFRLTPSGTQYTKTTLYSFLGSNDGQDPLGALVQDNTGALYGTTYNGGYSCQCGTVFKLTPSGSGYAESVLYRFNGGSDGMNPNGALVAGNAGVLYGTTDGGGTSGDGTVFELTPAGSSYTERILYSFKGGQDGAIPRAELLIRGGVLYSTTLAGGGGPCSLSGEPSGCGTVFALFEESGSFTESVLYRFQGGTDGANVYAGLIGGSHGTLYGTTGGGGNKRCRGPIGNVGCGTAFKLVQSGSKYVETVLHRFEGGDDGRGAGGDLTLGAGRKLYGMTLLGGTARLGTVFVLIPAKGSYRHKVLYSLQGPNYNDGANPTGALVFGKDGALYGETQAGGTANAGAVIRITP